jgi:hypothetical protein
MRADGSERHPLSDLLGCAVRDRAGTRLGFVNDVRLEPSAAVPGVSARLRVEGLIVADRSVGSMLGYERDRTQGPWPVRALVRWLHRRAAYVPWAAVGDIDWPGRTVVIDAGAVRPAGEPPSGW